MFLHYRPPLGTAPIRLSLHPSKLSSLYMMAILTLSGDVELNPGPYTPKYPCMICAKAVKWKQKAIQCDNCEGWYHTDCANMNSCVYEALANADISWICCQCGMPNFSSNLFASTLDMTTTNSFSSLQSNSQTDEETSLTPNMTPLATSSPRRPPSGRNRNARKLRVIVVNCQGMITKKETVAEMLQSVNPDILIATETHLKPDIASAEVLPPQYVTQAHRRDRPNRKGGGVLITAREDIMLTPLPEFTGTHSETVWAEVITPGRKIIVGSHYRPPRSPTAVLTDLDETISDIHGRYRNAITVLGGDFNLPGIDWGELSPKHGAQDVAHCDQLLEMSNHHNLHQLVQDPTRCKHPRPTVHHTPGSSRTQHHWPRGQ